MSPELRATKPPEVVHRLGRHPDAWAWPAWSHAGPDGTFGNRFDDPRCAYRVLYASTQRIGTFLETLARFRPDPAILAEEIAPDALDAEFETSAPGVLAIERWLAVRAIGTGRLEGRFCAIGHSESLARLRTVLAGRLVHFGLEDLDASTIRSHAPRTLTLEISRHVYEQESGEAPVPFAGLRYESRVGDELENWAIFEPNEPTGIETQTIEPDDPDLLAAVARFGLTLV